VNVRDFPRDSLLSARAFSCFAFTCLLPTTSYFSRVIQSTRRTGFHNRSTMAITTIHRSNLARSTANSMSAAKRIERKAIRFITRVQAQGIHGTGILANALAFSAFRRCLSSFAIAGSRCRGQRFEITSRQAKVDFVESALGGRLALLRRAA
jgi:hypothetical protein